MTDLARLPFLGVLQTMVRIYPTWMILISCLIP